MERAEIETDQGIPHFEEAYVGGARIIRGPEEALAQWARRKLHFGIGKPYMEEEASRNFVLRGIPGELIGQKVWRSLYVPPISASSGTHR